MPFCGEVDAFVFLACGSILSLHQGCTFPGVSACYVDNQLGVVTVSCLITSERAAVKHAVSARFRRLVREAERVQF